MYRQTFYEDGMDLLRQIGVPDEEAVNMKLVIPPHLMMKTCLTCDNNCRGCFAGLDGAQFCYECLYGYVYSMGEEKCIVDSSWSKTTE